MSDLTSLLPDVVAPAPYEAEPELSADAERLQEILEMIQQAQDQGKTEVKVWERRRSVDGHPPSAEVRAELERRDFTVDKGTPGEFTAKRIERVIVRWGKGAHHG